MYRFMLSRRWLLAHVLIVAVVATCVSLGLWQLRRLEERRARNRLTVARLSLPPVSTDTLLGAPNGGARSSFAFRRTEVRGVYDPDRQVTLHGRSLGGRPGTHALTPLVTAEGTALIVDRGWMPLKEDAGASNRAAPPGGVVRVAGILVPGEEPARIGPRRPSRPVEAIARIDLGLLGRDLPYPVYPLYVLLQDQDPPQPDGLPRPAELARLSEGPHLGYAVQWFLFGVVAVVGYGGLIRRAAKERASDATTPGKAPLPA
jgi:cytochrome oxidase assembly protein ShyY1